MTSQRLYVNVDIKGTKRNGWGLVGEQVRRQCETSYDKDTNTSIVWESIHKVTGSVTDHLIFSFTGDGVLVLVRR